MEHDTTARKLCRIAGLDDETLGRLARTGLVPSRVRLKTGWTVFDADALLPALIAGAWVRLGAAAVDSASLLLHIASLPEGERRDFANTVVLVKHVRGTSRVEWHIESDVPLFPGAQPQIYPLRRLIEEPK